MGSYFLIFGNLCLWGLPPDHVPQSQWVAWGFLLIHAAGLYQLTFTQHKQDVMALDGIHVDICNLALSRTGARISESKSASTSGSQPNVEQRRGSRRADLPMMRAPASEAAQELGARLLFIEFDANGDELLTSLELFDGLKKAGYMTNIVHLEEIWSMISNKGGISVTKEVWISYVSTLKPATDKAVRRHAFFRMLRDIKSYQIAVFLSAMFINLFFFTHRWDESQVDDGTYKILARVAGINLLISSFTGLNMHYKSCLQKIFSLEQTRLSVRNILWEYADHSDSVKQVDKLKRTDSVSLFSVVA